MCSSESRVELMKPLLIKAGILSVGAYIFTKLISKRSNSIIKQCSMKSQQNCHENEAIEDCESIHSLNLEPIDAIEEDLQIRYRGNLEYKLLDLESQIEDLQIRELGMKSRYVRYRALKEKESMMMEIRNAMLLEKIRAEFLLKEICLAQEENNRVGNLIMNLIKLYYNFQELKKENVLLERKVRKLYRRGENRFRIIREQKRLIETKDRKLMKNVREIERRDCVIQEIEHENKELKEVLDHLQREKIELTNKVDHVERLCSSDTKVEITQSVSQEDYDKILKELEQLQKDKKSEANELTYLKWSNACLRHELLRHHEQQELNKDDNENRVVEYEFQGHENGNSNNITSKRRRFIKKLKKWVEGGQSDEKEKNEIKCFGHNNKHSNVPEEAEDMFVHARLSCSSV